MRACQTACQYIREFKSTYQFPASGAHLKSTVNNPAPFASRKGGAWRTPATIGRQRLREHSAIPTGFIRVQQSCRLSARMDLVLPLDAPKKTPTVYYWLLQLLWKSEGDSGCQSYESPLSLYTSSKKPGYSSNGNWLPVPTARAHAAHI